MMLDKVKLALRKTAAVFDDEIEDYITSGIADLRLVGINVPENAGSSSETLGRSPFRPRNHSVREIRR